MDDNNFKELNPIDMPVFLNELAMRTSDDDTSWNLIQCSLFIQVVNSMRGESNE